MFQIQIQYLIVVVNQMRAYIGKEGEEQLKMFKYKGGNDSLTYAYLWSPLADAMLKWTPSHIAPNLISVISLIILVLAHIIFVLGVSTQKQIDWWRKIVMGLSIFVYQNLDNLDGKQARKTNSSSPLGMLFDHGIDAICTFLISIQMLQLLQLRSGSMKIFCIFIFAMIVFFCAMWSQYCVGSFKLGIVNPIDEGLPTYALFSIISIYIPYNFWNNQHLFATYNLQLLSCLVVFQIIVVYFMVRDNYHDNNRTTKDKHFALLLPVTYFIALSLLYLSQNNIFEDAQWPIFYTLLFSWSKNMIEIQICSVTKQSYNPFNVSTVCFIGLSIIYLLLDISPKLYFTFVAFIQFLIFLELVVSVSIQITNVLGIRVFTIRQQDQSNLSAISKSEKQS